MFLFQWLCFIRSQKIHGDCLLFQQWKEKLLAKEEIFQNMLQYTIAVDRQISATKTDDIVNCMVGTYKKLNVD